MTADAARLPGVADMRRRLGALLDGADRARLRALLRSPPPGPLRIFTPTGLMDVLREGPAPLERGGVTGDGPLRIGIVVPWFREGSGGHGTIANLVRGLEARGHRCELHVLDDEGRHADRSAEQVARSFASFFGPLAAQVHLGLGDWTGADVAVATGWQTAPAVLRLPGAAARAYLVQDHEPDFHGASAEREWAAWTYRQGLRHIAASHWLDRLLRERYASAGSAFDLAVDHERYAPPAGGGRRRGDLVAFYARPSTPRRATALGLLALGELRRRRPAVEIALFGESREIATSFAARRLGVLDGPALTRLYGEATCGMVLSLTNPSLVPLEMLACGLPVIDVASDSMRGEFGPDGPIALAEPDPLALADALERLLDDPDARARRSAAGLAMVAGRTWAAAAAQVEAGLRAALGEAWPQVARRAAVEGTD